MITKDLASDDAETRQRAHTAVHFLRYYDGGPLEDLGRLPIAPPGYSSPSRWSDGMRTPSEDGFPRPFSIRDEFVDGGGVVVPSIEDPVAGWENVPRERDGDGDGDADARRRRREAMVLHEGAGAVTGQDIIRPRTTG